MTVELLLGDCLEVMQTLPAQSVDVVLTDPPYDERTHKGAVTHGGEDQAEDLGIDEFEPLVNHEILVPELLRVSRRWCVSFCTLEDIKKWRDEAWKREAWVRSGIWDRVNPAPQFSGDRPSQACEGLAIMHAPGIRKRWNGGGHAAIWRYPVEFGKKLHPTQKPLKLIKKLIVDFTDPGETVLDPFMGSGTTAIACIELGRNFIGIEKRPDYFEIAQRRVKEAQAQPNLFSEVA